MLVRIGCIVEGIGDKSAAAVLVQRIARLVSPEAQVVTPHNAILVRPKSRLIKEAELKAAVGLVALRVAPHGGILVLLDADEDCPADLGPQLLRWARTERGDLPIGLVLAKSEFESWFLAAAESVAGRLGLRKELRSPHEPEGIRGAKEWLSRNMPRQQPYSETAHQAALARLFDLGLARKRSDSFDKCFREIGALVSTLAQAGEPA